MDSDQYVRTCFIIHASLVRLEVIVMTFIITYVSLVCLWGNGPCFICNDLHLYFSRPYMGSLITIYMQGLASLHMLLSSVHGVFDYDLYARTSIFAHASLFRLWGYCTCSICKVLHHYTLFSHPSTGLWSVFNMKELASLHMLLWSLTNTHNVRTFIIARDSLIRLRGFGPWSICEDLHLYT